MKDLREELNRQARPKKVQAKDPIAQLLDDSNTDNVVLFDTNGKPIEFEQVARIELDDYNEIFVILIPVTPVPGVEEGEGVVFSLDAQNGNLDVVEDQNVIDRVLEAYMKLLDEGNGQKGGNN